MPASSFPKLEDKISLLKQQKHKLRQRFLWRSILVSTIATSLLTATIIPHGQIKHPSQVQIEGTNLIAETTIHHLLNIQYPEFIWQIPSQKLSQNLESIPPIADTRINKQLFPPVLQVFIQERNPVAVAISASGNNLGFLDAQGIWLDPKYYEDSGTKIVIGGLKVLNFQSSYSSVWSEVYRLIKAYPSIKILEVRWDNSHNLYLKTSLGTVYLGSDLSYLEKQFTAMASLKNLPNHLQLSQIYYIDLTNPERYSIQKYPER
ncbi:MAG: FtsQ-type POTRA domain-containing protein [Xenococcaceae cyanobacterium MO_167.B27]|nr:FtsQ-type POTRA domain-containing protein [Xenococcaceae cyanobacterium MO_167.B27]